MMLNFRYVINYNVINSILLISIITLFFFTIAKYQDYYTTSQAVMGLEAMKDKRLMDIKKERESYFTSIDFFKKNIQKVLNSQSNLIINEQKFNITKEENKTDISVEYILSLETTYLSLIILMQDLNNIIRRVTHLEIEKQNDTSKNLQIIIKTKSLIKEDANV